MHTSEDIKKKDTSRMGGGAETQNRLVPHPCVAVDHQAGEHSHREPLKERRVLVPYRGSLAMSPRPEKRTKNQ